MCSMNLEKLLSSSKGQVDSESSLCSITSLLGLGGCRSQTDAAQSFAKKLQTKLWSLGRPGSITCASNGLVSDELDDEEIVSSSWVPSLSSAVTVEARLDVNRGVVTSVPVINRTVSINFVKKRPEVMERRKAKDHLIATWMSESTPVTTMDQESDSSSTTNPLSDSDRYFDFGIETPLDYDSGSSSTGDETIAHELVVINQDDGLPILPESGCIFGSPVLISEEETEEVAEDEDRDEEPSSYESLSESSANFIHKVNNISLDTWNSPELHPTENGSEDLTDLARHVAHAPDSGDSSQQPLPRDDCARVDPSQSQGCLEDAADNSEPVHSQHICELAAEQWSVHISADVLIHDEKQLNGDMLSDMIPLDPVEYLSVSSDNVSRVVSAVDVCISSADDFGEESNGFSFTNDDPQQPDEGEEESGTDITAFDKEESEKATEEDDGEEDNLFRHRVQRSTSLKTGKTPPGTPGRKKIVRFADALGLDLALVRTFLDEVPNVPPSAFSDLSGVEDSEVSSSPFSLTISTFSGGKATTSSYLPVSHSRIVSPSNLNLQQQLRTLVASFTQPGSLPNFVDIVKRQKVCLETACLVDDLRLRGVVRVLNIDFHKSVIIRFTTDEWKTNNDQVATYVPGSCDGLSDRFSFSLGTGAQSLQPGQRLIFALCYRVGGQEIWDSNQGKNYVFQCISNSSYTPSIALRQSCSNPDDFLHDSFLPYM